MDGAVAYIPAMRFRGHLTDGRGWLAAIAAVAIVGCSIAQPSTAPTPTRVAVTQAPPGSIRPTTAPSGSPAPPASLGPLDLGSIAVTLEPFAQVDGGPLAMAAPDDGTGRLFVASQDGRIWVLDADGTVHPEPMTDLSSRLESGGEQGLLGLALHPSFPTDSRVFVNYTDENGDTIVASLNLDTGDANRLDPSTHRRYLFVDQPYANHNGGAVLFGPDGYLYVFLGDGGSGGDPQNNGQNRNALLGKVLRIDVDSTTGDLDYGIPPDNPFVDRNGADEVWLLGLRNPWRASFDRATGDLWLGDVGQGAYEEIDVARAGEGGINYGWNRMEGAHCFPPGAECRGDTWELPVSEYGRDLGCTIIGGYVYRGAAYPELVGAYLFADYCTARIFAMDSLTTELVEPVELGTGSGRVAAFGEDVAGELYLLALDGTVSRIVATSR